MRERSEFLTEREIFVLENHPAMSYKAIATELGLSHERVRQLKMHAERMIREEKEREQREARNQLPVAITIKRKDLWVIYRSLCEYRHQLWMKKKPDMRRKEDSVKVDLDFEIVDRLIDDVSKILLDKNGEPSADGRGSAPPELAEQSAEAGGDAAPATPPL